MLMTASVSSLMPRQELQEDVGIGGRLPGFGIAGVKMEDGRPFSRRADGVVGDLLRRDRERESTATGRESSP